MARRGIAEESEPSSAGRAASTFVPLQITHPWKHVTVVFSARCAVLIQQKNGGTGKSKWNLLVTGSGDVLVGRQSRCSKSKQASMPISLTTFVNKCRHAVHRSSPSNFAKSKYESGAGRT